MISLIGILRKIRHRYIPGRFPGLSALRAIYRFGVTKAFWLKGKGVSVDIAGLGEFKLHPLLAFGKYEEWGSGHNSGLKEWVDSCRGKTAVFDIGAHIGLYSLPASRAIHDKGVIYAFEPAQKNFAFFQEHLNYNGIKNIALLPYLVGESASDEVAFYEQKDGADGMSSIVIHKNRHLYTKTAKKQVCLDDFCRQGNIMPQVIKIDVEGAENFVLRGARGIIRRCRPIIFLSVHPGRLERIGENVESLRKIISDLGYAAFDTDGNQVHEYQFQEYILKPAI